MKKILAFKGSPRTVSNSDILLSSFLHGAKKNSNFIETIDANKINIEYCSGCLRCNLIKRCSNSSDEWYALSKKILEADVLVFASPVYFHHLTAPLKIIVDRFRSFTNVQITENGLIHTPYHKWNKEFVLLLSMGSPNPVEAEPVIKLFKFITSILGKQNTLNVINGTRLGVGKQILKTEEELKILYKKIALPINLASKDYINNMNILQKCKNMGEELSKY